MAIDTRNKRFNCMSVARAFTVTGPNPDASLATQADRQQVAFAYSGILARELSVASGVYLGKVVCYSQTVVVYRNTVEAI